MSTATKRVLSGMRPTGRLHIGHYFGALQNWVRLQNDPAYECFYCVVDWHALTSDYADTSGIAENSLQVMIDFLASGLDPKKSTIFLQSLVPEHAEMHLLLSMITPLGWVERIPTYKEQLENIKNKDLHTYGFLGYPVLQCADIVAYSEPGKGLVVPVGEDQVSHLEFSRELVRRFNLFYGFLIKYSLFDGSELSRSAVNYFEKLVDRPDVKWSHSFDKEVAFGMVRALRRYALEVGYENLRAKIDPRYRQFLDTYEVLTEPQVLLTKYPRIPGLDGRKMSKSYGNAISLSESDADIRAKTKVMVTDPARKRRTDPGNPDVCPAYDWHKLFSPPDTLKWAAEGCRSAGIGCIECKAAMADNLIKWIEPVRERRVRWEEDQKGVLDLLESGSQKAREFAKQTLARVRESIFHWQSKRASL